MKASQAMHVKRTNYKTLLQRRLTFKVGTQLNDLHRLGTGPETFFSNTAPNHMLDFFDFWYALPVKANTHPIAMYNLENLLVATVTWLAGIC